MIARVTDLLSRFAVPLMEAWSMNVRNWDIPLLFELVLHFPFNTDNNKETVTTNNKQTNNKQTTNKTYVYRVAEVASLQKVMYILLCVFILEL